MYKKIILILIFSLVLPFSLLAEKAPEDVVKEMLAKAKGGNTSAVLDYVHWDSAYTDIGAEKASAIGVSSASGLKQFIGGLIVDPGKFFDTMVSKQLESMPEEQRKMIEPMVVGQMAGIKKQADDKKEALEKKLKEGEFEVGKSSISGNNATVPVKITVDGKTDSQDLKLKKVDGKWYMAFDDIEKGSLF